MNPRCRHVVVETAWGFFGLSGADYRLKYTSLPIADRASATGLITAFRPDSRHDTALFKDLQERVKAYFEGSYDDFSDVPTDLTGLSAFAQRVLSACRKIPYGQTASYAELARLARSPKAARAAGSVMAANPMPLIVPCHRIIRSDGQAGDFAATGGPRFKAKLLALEARVVCAVTR